MGSFVFTSDSLSLFKGIVCNFVFKRTILTNIAFEIRKMLAIVVHENMKLGDNTLNNERLSLVKKKKRNLSSGLKNVR